MDPEIRASRPSTIWLEVGFVPFNQAPYAAAKVTISIGLRPSPGFPPIVPRMPEIDLINAKTESDKGKKKAKINEFHGEYYQVTGWELSVFLLEMIIPRIPLANLGGLPKVRRLVIFNWLKN
jgi:hypothetical protein